MDAASLSLSCDYLVPCRVQQLWGALHYHSFVFIASSKPFLWYNEETKNSKKFSNLPSLTESVILYFLLFSSSLSHLSFFFCQKPSSSKCSLWIHVLDVKSLAFHDHRRVSVSWHANVFNNKVGNYLKPILLAIPVRIFFLDWIIWVIKAHLKPRPYL